MRTLLITLLLMFSVACGQGSERSASERSRLGGPVSPCPIPLERHVIEWTEDETIWRGDAVPIWRYARPQVREGAGGTIHLVAMVSRNDASPGEPMILRHYSGKPGAWKSEVIAEPGDGQISAVRVEIVPGTNDLVVAWIENTDFIASVRARWMRQGIWQEVELVSDEESKPTMVPERGMDLMVDESRCIDVAWVDWRVTSLVRNILSGGHGQSERIAHRRYREGAWGDVSILPAGGWVFAESPRFSRGKDGQALSWIQQGRDEMEVWYSSLDHEGRSGRPIREAQVRSSLGVGAMDVVSTMTGRGYMILCHEGGRGIVRLVLDHGAICSEQVGGVASHIGIGGDAATIAYQGQGPIEQVMRAEESAIYFGWEGGETPVGSVPDMFDLSRDAHGHYLLAHVNQRGSRVTLGLIRGKPTSREEEKGEATRYPSGLRRSF